MTKKIHIQNSNTRKLVVLVIFMAGFAGLGAYYLLFSSHAQTPRSIVGFGGYKCTSNQKLSTGSTGDCVRAIQFGLNNWNTYHTEGLAPLSADGKFSEKTKAAVQKFQSKNGLPADGTVDQNTWNAFLLDCSTFQACAAN